MVLLTLADSEDEEEDLLVDHESSINVHATVSTQIVDTKQEQDNSTGSTERLKRQIAQAEHDLTTKSVDKMAAYKSASMPGQTTETPSLKRRHSELMSEPMTSTKQSKRSKSTKVTSSFSSGLFLNDAFGNNALFSEHSQRLPSSGFAPPGSIEEGFLAHDPFSIFGQSGDTVPDNTATQHLVRQMAAEKEKSSSDAIAAPLQTIDEFQALQSSSVLLTNSQLYDSSKSQDVDKTGIEDHNTNVLQKEPYSPSQANAHVVDKSTSSLIDQSVHAESEHVDPDDSLPKSIHVAPRASRQAKDTIDHKPAADTGLSDPLSSQTALIGLPPERYVPRPSRRRATQLPEITENLTTSPEKSTRAKRSKTSSANFALKESSKSKKQTQSQDDSEVLDQGASQDAVKEKNVTEHDPIHIDNGNAPADEISAAPNPPPTDSVYTVDELALTQSSEEITVKPTSATKDVFVKPAPPKRGRPASKKSKRSHTTIFEDHVDLTLSQQEPTLSQQQAERKAALLEVENTAEKRKNKRGKRKIVDEELDELAPDYESHGKHTANKSFTKADDPVELPEVAASSSPVKSARPAAQGPEKQKSMTDDTEDVQAARSPGASMSPSTQEPQHALTPNATPPQQKEKLSHSAADTGTGAAPKSSPVTHSPIKITTGRIVRVGLSKRQRIPSLLKIVRPSKK